MNKKRHFLILLILSSLLINCGASKKVIIPIEVQNKAISIYPLRGVENFIASPLCDSCSNKKLFNKMVKTELDHIYKNLLSELRRCAKLGLYSVTDSISPHDISIVLEFAHTTLSESEDTLSIPFKVSTTDLNNRQKEIRDFNIKIAIPQYDSLNEKSLLYSAGRSLLTFRKNFPYQDIINRYYSINNQESK